MRSLISGAAAAVLMFAGASNSFADAEDGQGYLSILASHIDSDSDRNVEDGIYGGQVGLGYAINENWNLEGVFSFAEPGAASPAAADPEHRGIGVDVQRVFRRSERFSPYLLAGIGSFIQNLDGESDGGAMGTVGAGFYLDLFSSDVALRGEIRHRIESSTSSSFSDNLLSLGLQIPFGQSRPTWSDSDGDGIEDGSDRCHDTASGARVDDLGCEIVVKPVSDTDDDGDGIVNRLDECPDTPAGAQVDVEGCEIKEEIRLEGVNFETNSDRLAAGAQRILEDAAATLKKNPTIKVEVAGHTDSDGDAGYNQGLSARRAQTVYDYLANAGIGLDRMTVRGYGESRPVANNATAAGKAQNRRVVLRITER